MVLGFAADFYRDQMRSIAGSQAGAAPPAHYAALERCLLRLDRCLEGIVQLDRYANQAMLIDSWWDDIARA
jgi:hypothetical protein